MTDGFHPVPIVLDSSVLLAYERLQTPSGALREGQSWIAEWLVDGVTLVIPAVSLAITAQECGGKVAELEFLLAGGDAEQVLVVPLAETSAIAVGAAAASTSGDDLEVAQVVWCAVGQVADPRLAERWQVATYVPSLYDGKGVPVIRL